MSNMTEYAERELRAAGYFDKDSDYGGMVGPAVLAMVEQFAAEGHSGMSAGLCIHLFERVASHRPLVPLENPLTTSEYRDVSEYSNDAPGSVLQSTRLPSLFSMDSGGTWYDLDLDRTLPWWRRKLLLQRHIYLTFPYMPK